MLFRQLVKDYDHYCYVGFAMALWVLPVLLAKPEDRMDQNDFEGEEAFDPGNEEKMKEMMEKATKKLVNGFHSEPYIKTALAGNFLEMIERGFFTLN